MLCQEHKLHNFLRGRSYGRCGYKKRKYEKISRFQHGRPQHGNRMTKIIMSDFSTCHIPEGGMGSSGDRHLREGGDRAAIRPRLCDRRNRRAGRSDYRPGDPHILRLAGRRMTILIRVTSGFPGGSIQKPQNLRPVMSAATIPPAASKKAPVVAGASQECSARG